MLPLVSDNFTSLGELRSVPRLLHDTSLPFQGPGAGNSALFEAGIERIDIYAGRKEQFKKERLFRARERGWKLKRPGKGNKKGGMSSQHQSSPLTLIGILWMICILDVRCFRTYR
ncbi:hypothetical protein CEXT_501571 [Caerostris extrusa]|uniref:Uncharacterized protein n=1 Tax=Caerostris extrusa TaxID=172846 RepID=A0AAV4T6R3_CAEEX|nr:hypothetical protein CEXT_501571 [Caerostris extrusa]